MGLPITLEELIAGLSKMPTATLHEAAWQQGDLPASIKPLAPDMRLCGPAFPLRCSKGDNLGLHQAIYAAEPGQVIVADCQAAEFGHWGAVMTVAALTRGLAGLVISGGVRDSQQIQDLRFPVFASCVSVRGTSKVSSLQNGCGCEVTLGRARIRPGDVVCGDGDGVVVIPLESAGEILARCAAREEAEVEQFRRLRAGSTTLELLKLGTPHDTDARHQRSK
jgi:4-hydroxy-4-methyl-2-oxoglutarate aldolase